MSRPAWNRAEMLPGMKFGRLTIVNEIEKNRYGRRRFLCLCDCGNEHHVASSELRSGNTKSCGCLHNELIAKRNRSHGKSQSGTYTSWRAMHDRCANKNSERYAEYGGRGITVCEQWKQFETFLSDMGERPPGKKKEYSLDRIDNDGNYEPKNCRWATNSQQNLNKGNTRRERCVCDIGLDSYLY
jgi:hypothetical protein